MKIHRAIDPNAGAEFLRLEAAILEEPAELERLAAGAPRTFTARLVTFGEQTRDHRKLSFAPGSFAGSEQDVPLAYAHMTSGFLSKPIIIGHSLRIWEDSTGAYGEFQLSTTPDAEEVWTLIQDGSLRSVSAGGLILRFEFNEETEELTVLGFDLMEVSVVPIPALKSAGIVKQSAGVLVTLGAEQLGENKGGPNMQLENETAPADTEQDVETRLATVEDLVRTKLAELSIPRIEVKKRGAHYRTLGSLVADVVLMDRERSIAAKDRLGALLEAGALYFAPNGRRMIDLFAFEVADSSDLGTVTDDADALLGLLYDGRVIANGFAKGNLDDVSGTVVPMRKITDGALVDYQTEGGAVASNKQVWGDESYDKITLAGGQSTTVQARDWSSPAYMQEVLADLIAAYGEKLNYEVVNGDGAAGPPVHASGILTEQATRIDATATTASGETVAGQLVEAIGTAKASVYTGSKRWPQSIYMSGDVLGTIDGMHDADGRPLLMTDGFGANPLGAANGPIPAGRIRGLTAYADDSIGTDLAIVASFRDAKLWESQGAPVNVALFYPDALTVDVAVYGFAAVAIRRAGSFAVISNIGVTA